MKLVLVTISYAVDCRVSSSFSLALLLLQYKRRVLVLCQLQRVFMQINASQRR